MRKKMDMITIDKTVRSELQEKKYVIIAADKFSFTTDLEASRRRLWEDWDNLKEDNYLKNGAHYRLRRFGLFYFLPAVEELVPLPPSHYFQSSEVNRYAGGIERKFVPLSDTTLSNQFLHELIKFDFKQFPVNNPMSSQAWEIDIHQFRIVASPDEQGEPTPEGIHHDGDDFNVIHLVSRKNATGGVSTIYDNDRKKLASCTLQQPMDSIMVWDPYVMHGVTPIQPDNPHVPAIRDVIVIGYNFRPGLKLSA